MLTLTAIGCVNLAGLLFARGVRMEHEVAVRSGLLGAGRWRLIAQPLSESLLHSIAGGALGRGPCLLACCDATRTAALRGAQPGSEVQLNATVLVALAGGFDFHQRDCRPVAGRAQSTRCRGQFPDVAERRPRRHGSRTSTGLRGALHLDVQVALAPVLLITSGLVFARTRPFAETRISDSTRPVF